MKHKRFVCKNCGYESSTWLGKCPSCGSYNSFVEIGEQRVKDGRGQIEIESLKEILRFREFSRYPTGIDELDRVLGGGVVKGAYILLAGEPGVGKSTLILQIADSLSKEGKVLYFSGEESREQIGNRAKRIGIRSQNIYVISNVSVEAIEELAKEFKPLMIIVDSIQTIYSEKIESVAGSITQVRECGNKLMEIAKSYGITVMVIGHITKSGEIAGPKVLEHMVDVVLQLERDERLGLRILRALKNRFGPTEEIGLFVMTAEGLRPADILKLQKEYLIKELPEGTALSMIIEGTRGFLIEVQALVNMTPFNLPMRNVSGYDIRRLQMLLAVLENHLGISLRGYDVFVNIAGGFNVKDPGIDLAVSGAILSAYKKKQPFKGIALLGEISLSGEIKPPLKLERRIEELKRLGIRGILTNTQKRKDIEIYPVKHLKEVLKWF